MNERVFNDKMERLRRPERLALIDFDRIVETTLKGIDSGKILDVGTGSGLFAEQFSKRGLQVYGVDFNPEMLEAAKHHVSDAIFNQSKAEQLPFSDKFFDVVFLGFVLHEVDDYLATLKEAKRVCVKRVCVLEWQYKEQDFGPPLAHRLKPEQVEGFARDAGFANISHQSIGDLTMYIFNS